MKLTIGNRILLGFGLLELLALGVGAYVVYQMAEMRSIDSVIKERDLRILDLLDDVAQTQGAMRGTRERAVSQALASRQKLTKKDSKVAQAEWRRGRERTVKLLTDMEALSAEYEKGAASPARKAQWGLIRQNAVEALNLLKELEEGIEPMYTAINKGEFDRLPMHFAAVDRLRRAYDAKLAAGSKVIREQIDIGDGLARATYHLARTSSVVGLILLLVFGAVAALLIQRSITRPLGTFIRLAEQVGQGDLTQKAPGSNVRELEQLGRSLNAMVTSLREVTQQTLAGTQNLNSATVQIVASTQEQAAGTREQAATVQEITTTMEEVSQSGAQISRRAKDVATAAEATSAASNAGLQAVQESNRSMRAIREQVEEVAGNIVALSEKTQAVGEIIATVNDLAERSNLLALNAAIEAAAAGEQGNRFRVVASEMKNLADQAKESTVQVRSILGDIQKGINSSVMFTEEAVKRAEAGKRQADLAEQTIRQMAKTTQESVQAFEQIIAANNQQQIGFEQVAQGMKDIRQAVGQTATATGQLEKAVANLNALGQELKRTVGRYQL